MKKIIKIILKKLAKNFIAIANTNKMGRYFSEHLAKFIFNQKMKINYNNVDLSFYVPNRLNKYRVDTFSIKEPETLKWIEKFEKNSNFWDVGANIGLYSCYAAKTRNCNVYAFEPSVFNLEILAKNIDLNNSIHLGRSYKKFELFNHIGKRDVFSSIKLGRSLVSKDSSMLDLIRPLNELFQELLFIKIFKGTNRSQNSFSLLSPSIRKNIPQYAKNFSSKEIVLAIKKLAKIDKQIKTSKIDDKSAITEFIHSTTSNG